MKYMRDANKDIYLRAHDLVAFLNNLESAVAPDLSGLIDSRWAFTKTLGEIRLAISQFEKRFSGR